MAGSESISEVLSPCEAGKCLYQGTVMEGACPVSDEHPCLNFTEACRLRKKYWDAENSEILAHIDLMTVRGIRKSPPPPDNPAAYLRTISRNLEKDLVEEDKKRKAVYEASREEGPLAEFVVAMKEAGFGEDPLEIRDSAAFFLRNLPAEAVFPNTMSTRDFMVEYSLYGMKPSEMLEKYPNLTVNEIKFHQLIIRQTRQELQERWGDF